MKFRPLHDRVVIRRIEGEDKTKDGIIIPDTVKEKPQEGIVAVGLVSCKRLERLVGCRLSTQTTGRLSWLNP